MKRIFTIFGVIFLMASVFAQPPEKMSYQAVIRNSSDALVNNTKIGIEINIRQGSATGTIVYTETQTPTTNANGLVSIEIGGGAGFSSINWVNGPFFIETKTDITGGTNYTITGTSQLLSVPYALHAKTANGITGTINETDPVYGLSVASGITAADTAKWNKAVNGNVLVIPKVVTTSITNIRSNSATFSGTVTGVDINQIDQGGFAISTSPKPKYFYDGLIDTIGAYIKDGIITASSDLTAFVAGTTYYARACAVMDNGLTIYGNELTFTTLSVGQVGPSGGLVFYDKGNFSDGWRYLEVAAADQSNGIQWGCNSTQISGTSYVLGSGEANTALIVAGCSDANFAAKLCDNLTLGGQSDWFLPSFEELVLIGKNLFSKGMGSLSFAPYWTSTVTIEDNNAFNVTFFEDGVFGTGGRSKDELLNVRAIRSY